MQFDWSAIWLPFDFARRPNDYVDFRRGGWSLIIGLGPVRHASAAHAYKPGGLLKSLLQRLVQVMFIYLLQCSI